MLCLAADAGRYQPYPAMRWSLARIDLQAQRGINYEAAAIVVNTTQRFGGQHVSPIPVRASWYVNFWNFSACQR